MSRIGVHGRYAIATEGLSKKYSEDYERDRPFTTEKRRASSGHCGGLIDVIASPRLYFHFVGVVLTIECLRMLQQHCSRLLGRDSTFSGKDAQHLAFTYHENRRRISDCGLLCKTKVSHCTVFGVYDIGRDW